MNPGATFSHTFNTAGSFAYFCTFHSSLGMVGTVVVQAGGGGGGATLPATGAGDSTVPFVWIGLLFLVTGAAVLYALRRRRA
jgi:LPXTG-motif cell wall-anchored protein